MAPAKMNWADVARLLATNVISVLIFTGILWGKIAVLETEVRQLRREVNRVQQKLDGNHNGIPFAIRDDN